MPGSSCRFFCAWWWCCWHYFFALVVPVGLLERSVESNSSSSIDVQPGLLSPEVRLGAGVPSQHIAVGVVLLLHKQHPGSGERFGASRLSRQGQREFLVAAHLR